jgi:integrase
LLEEKHPSNSNHGGTMAKITKTAVDALQAKRRADGSLTDNYLWDSETKGFGCKCTPAGKKVYVFQFRTGGRGAKTQRLTLGVHGSITCDQARDLAKRHMGAKASGRDPAQEQREARKQKETAMTFAECCERYLTSNGENNRSWGETRRLLEYDAVRVWGTRPAASIGSPDAAKLIEEVKARAPVTARALFRQLRPLFAWAKPLGFIAANPMDDIKCPPPPKARDRVLNDDEIRAFWRGTEKLGWPFGQCFQLLLLTAQREDEVAGIESSELDRAMLFWRLPGGDSNRTKNGLGHLVDVSPQAYRILSRLPRPACEGGRSFLFTTTGSTPISGFSKAKARLDEFMCAELNGDLWSQFMESGGKFDTSKKLTDEARRRRDEAAQKLGFADAAALQASILPRWRLHDLRRTAATGMAGLGVPPHIVERVLNHLSGAQGGLTGVYQHHEYRTERKDALLRWGSHVERLLSGEPLPEKSLSITSQGVTILQNVWGKRWMELI